MVLLTILFPFLILPFLISTLLYCCMDRFYTVLSTYYCTLTFLCVSLCTVQRNRIGWEERIQFNLGLTGGGVKYSTNGMMAVPCQL